MNLRKMLLFFLSIVFFVANSSARVNVFGDFNCQLGKVDLSVAAEYSVKAVVHIKTLKYGEDKYDSLSILDYFFGNNDGYYREKRPIMSSGSGVIVSPDGYIVTNNHVIKNSTKIEVVLNDKRSFEAKLVGNDASTDLALLKIDSKNLKYLKYGDSESLRLGEWVLAVGNPYNLTSTVTAGIVSAKSRNLGMNNGQMSLESFIQTDAAVNPGNSGGALVNTKGELIGINTAISSKTGSYSGYSFAIPSNIVKKVISDIKKYGVVKRAVLGISIREINTSFAAQMNLDGVKGIWISDVYKGGAAYNSNIKSGDVILDINGIEVNTIPELQQHLVVLSPGEKVSLKIRRGKKDLIKVIVLQNLYDNTTNRSATSYNIFGAKLIVLRDIEKEKYGIDSGLKVVEIRNGFFRQAGIFEGFIILKINNTELKSIKDLQEVATHLSKAGGAFVTALSPSGKLCYYAFSLKD